MTVLLFLFFRQQLPILNILQHLHLLYRNFVQLFKPLALRKPVVNEHGVQIFHIGKANQLIYCRVVADISF